MLLLSSHSIPHMLVWRLDSKGGGGIQAQVHEAARGELGCFSSFLFGIFSFCHLRSEGPSVAGARLCVRASAQPTFVDVFILCFLPHQRDFVLKRLSSIPDLVTAVPQGAFYVFPDVSAHFGKSAPDGTVIRGATDMCLYLLRCVFHCVL